MTVAWEARLRRMMARFRGKSETAATYRELGSLVRHIRAGRHAAVKRAVENAARSLRAIAAMQDHTDGP